MLPVHVIPRLLRGESPILEDIPDVTILFSDIVGYTEMAASCEPKNVVDMLNGVFFPVSALCGHVRCHGTVFCCRFARETQIFFTLPLPFTQNGDSALVWLPFRCPGFVALQCHVGVGTSTT